MSGTAAVPNTFASAVTATGAQLDANWSTVVAYLNDPTNRNNYAADSGATNTVVLTFAPPVVGGYTAGLEITFKSASTNSGGVVLNANGLGNKSLVNHGGSALVPGQLQAGSEYKAVYDGTAFIFINGPTPATKAQQIGTSDQNAYVRPSIQQEHPSAAKAAALWEGTATGSITPQYAYNIASVVRLGTGTYAVTFQNGFTSTLWVGGAWSSNAGAAFASVGSKGTLTCLVTLLNINGNATDSGQVNFVTYGTLL